MVFHEWLFVGATYWRGRTDGGARDERRRLAFTASGRLRGAEQQTGSSV